MTDLRVTRYSHYFSVFAFTVKGRIARRAFSEKFIEMALTKKRGRFIKEQKRIFARRDVNKEEVSFHINCYDNFIECMRDNGCRPDDLEIIDVPMYEPVRFEFKTETTPWENQVPLIEFCAQDGIQKVITLQPGGGKAQSLNALIRTPTGWKRMGDMVVGDKVIARDSTTAAVTGVFPQGKTESWRVHFSDGRSTDVNPDHLWSIQMRSNENSQIIDTREIKRRLDLNNDRSKRISVPLCIPEEGVDKIFPVDPYILGVILGDGAISYRSVQISKPDFHIRNKIASLLPSDLKVSEIESSEGLTFSIINNMENAKGSGKTNSMVLAMRGMGLAGKRSWEKFVPAEYLEGSANQRRELLRGLLDTDGTVDTKTTVSFSSSSRELSEAVQYLVRSLGGIATMSPRSSAYTYKGETLEGRTDYRVFIQTKTPTDLFSLPRKLNLACGTNQYRLNLRLRISHIEVLEPEETQCIMIDHPEHLYVTDDFIVTHNTLISLLAAAANGTRFAVITLGGYEDRWVPEFYEKLNLKPHEVRSCCGCVKLYRLLREVQATGIPEVKAIFISTATIRDFIKNWNSGKVFGSGCEDIHPETLWEFLGVGLRITDEVHKEFHGNFVGDLYAHIPKTIYLTATLFPNTDFMREMYEIALPKRVRQEPAKLNVYVECVRTLYNLKDPQKARFVGGQGSYSHTTYEQWIMADPKRENNYLEAIYVYALNNWMIDRRPEHKLLIFAATIEMCQKLCQYFLRRAPDLISNSYTAGDDYQLLIDSDIICSTIGKSGTAVDIPFLTQAYLTVAIDSPNANVQALGRLRELKGDDAFAQSFHVFICLNIEKHMAYWDSKSKLFSNRITKVRTAYLDRVI